MKEGRIQQIGTPNEIYHYPANMFTASFIGAPTINFISGAIKENRFIVFDKEQQPLITFDVPPELLQTTSAYQDGGIILGVRPETITIEDSDAVKDGRCVLQAEVLTLELLGAEYHAVLDVNGLKLVCRIPARHEIKTRQRMKVAFDIRHVQFFDEKTGLRIKYENN
jgi:multiple sugar transport system ATP-binding protein